MGRTRPHGRAAVVICNCRGLAYAQERSLRRLVQHNSCSRRPAASRADLTRKSHFLIGQSAPAGIGSYFFKDVM